MTEAKFKEIMLCNEPDFEYGGELYSICFPNGKYYVTASDRPEDDKLEFDSLDALLDGWKIQGKTLRNLLPFIDM